MEVREQQLAHLERLAEALTRNRLSARLVDERSKPYLKVANADTPTLNERVLCYQTGDSPWAFWWPWEQPIGSVDDLELVVSRIALVLRSVEAGE
jgi:hypothetical protein